jgi:hypothetical protein
MISGGFAFKEVVLLFAAAVGAAEAAEDQHADSHSDEHREQGSKRE